MAEYSWNRRTPKVPRLNPISKSEAAESTELKRTQAYERGWEAIADDLKKQNEKPKRDFSELLKKKK